MTMIDWNAPLFDDQGCRHHIVALNHLEVVTRNGVTFSLWKRRGQCLKSGYESRKLSNVNPRATGDLP